MIPTISRVHQLAQFLDRTPGWKEWLSGRLDTFILADATQIVGAMRELRESSDSCDQSCYSEALSDLLDPITTFYLSGTYYIPDDEVELDTGYVSLTFYEGRDGAKEYEDQDGEVYELHGDFICQNVDEALEALVEGGVLSEMPVWTDSKTSIPAGVDRVISVKATYYIVDPLFAEALERDDDDHVLVQFGDATIWRREACGQSVTMDPYITRVVLNCYPFHGAESLRELCGLIHAQSQVPVPLAQFGWSSWVIQESYFDGDGKIIGVKAYDPTLDISRKLIANEEGGEAGFLQSNSPLGSSNVVFTKLDLLK